MAWQLHYTSVEAGPTGRAGFQFVAESLGLPDGLQAEVARYLTYKPPPGAPLTPTPGQVLAMPAALAYAPLGRESVLARCVYLGRDYSGRYGNFLGHAVVLAEDDLVGLRPVEFWGAGLWSDSPAVPGAALPEIHELTPGSFVDPESLGAWLASGGEDAYRRLVVLLRTVHEALTRGHGRLVLVTGDVEDVVRWIAVISYSLPWAASTRLSFVTYSADPGSASQIIVGTTPDVWLPSDIDATVVELDGPPPEVEAGRFAGTVVDFWRRMDLDGIDALGEFGDEDPETVAALLALCRGDGSVSASEQSAVARLIGTEMPDWVWADLGRGAGLMGHELAAAVSAAGPAEAAGPCAARCAVLAMRDPELAPPALPLTPRDREALAPEAVAALGAARELRELAGVVRAADSAAVPLPAREVERVVSELVLAGGSGLAEAAWRIPHDWREVLLSGAVIGLERASSELRAELLTPEVCGLLTGRSWPTAPRTGATVLRRLVESGRLGRVEATIAIVRFTPAPKGAGGAKDAEDARECDAALGGIWREPPTPAECARLLNTLGDAMNVSAHLLDLPARAFLQAGLKGPEVERLAEQVRESLSGGYPLEDAETVLIAARLADAPHPGEAAEAVEQLTELTERGDKDLGALARKTAAKALARRDPRFRTTVAKRTAERSRRWLVSAWLAAKINRDERLALLEIAIRLRMGGVVVVVLDEWARSQIHNWSLFGSVEAHFKHDPELAAGLKELSGPRRRFFGRGGR